MTRRRPLLRILVTALALALPALAQAVPVESLRLDPDVTLLVSRQGQIPMVFWIPVRHFGKGANQLRLHRFQSPVAVLRIPVPLICELHLAAPAVPGRLEAQRHPEGGFRTVRRLPPGRSGYGYVVS